MEPAGDVHHLNKNTSKVQLIHWLGNHWPHSTAHFTSQRILVRTWRDPARLMHNLDQLHKITVHHGQQHSCDSHLVMFGEFTHNRAVQCDKAWILRVDSFHKDIARMHVSMEKVVTEYLGKENG